MNRKPTYEELKQKVLAMQDELANCKVIEKNLKVSEEHYKQSVTNSPNPIFSVDQRGRIYTWNSSCERVFQYGQEMVGHSFKALFDKHDHYIDAKEMVAQVFNKKTLNNKELTYRRKDGILRFTVSRLYPVLDFNGEVKRCVFANTDITERKQVEDKLNQSEQELRLITDALPVMIAYVDSGQRYRFNNQAYVEWFGYSKNDFYGKHIIDVLGESIYQQIRPHVDKVLSGKEITYENKVSYEDGRERYVAVTYIPHKEAEGEVKGFYALVSDVSRQKKAEEALQKARDTLEEKVKEQTLQLEEANERLEKLNTGLQVLIEHRQEEMKRLQENIMNNVNKLITPYLEKMDKKRIGSKNMAYLDVIASGLKELVSPFAGTLSSKEVVLSPTEIQVANLIRQGKTSKEIAFLMNVSANAITVHRYKIRKKLGLLNKKVNLMAYLQNLPKQ